jgi:hypothetical protein
MPDKTDKTDKKRNKNLFCNKNKRSNDKSQHPTSTLQGGGGQVGGGEPRDAWGCERGEAEESDAMRALQV